MADNFISGLPEAASLSGPDVLPVVSGGVTKKVRADALGGALPVATTLEKGLMSAADKAALTQAQLNITELQGRPYSAVVESASIISIPDGVNIIILTGSTNIATVVGALDYRTYTFAYPVGAGLNLLGVNMVAGDVFVAVYTP